MVHIILFGLIFFVAYFDIRPYQFVWMTWLIPLRSPILSSLLLLDVPLIMDDDCFGIDSIFLLGAFVLGVFLDWLPFSGKVRLKKDSWLRRIGVSKNDILDSFCFSLCSTILLQDKFRVLTNFRRLGVIDEPQIPISFAFLLDCGPLIFPLFTLGFRDILVTF